VFFEQVLGGIADTVAQSLTAIKSRSKQQSKYGGKQDFISIEVHELGKEKDSLPGELIPSRNGPPPFDFERLTRFAAYGFLMAPVQYTWFGFLARSFPIVKGNGTVPAMKRVAMDQLVFAPVSMEASRSLQRIHC
jgi:protein Mpv17